MVSIIITKLLFSYFLLLLSFSVARPWLREYKPFWSQMFSLYCIYLLSFLIIKSSRFCFSYCHPGLVFTKKLFTIDIIKESKGFLSFSNVNLNDFSRLLITLLFACFSFFCNLFHNPLLCYSPHLSQNNVNISSLIR
jgi:hypothetical protein